MGDTFYRVVGRLSLPLDWIRRRRHGGGRNGQHDKTGILLRDARRLRRLVDSRDLLVVEYDSLCHTFWRAQELSLFRRHLHFLGRPLLDFGCGDGSFASSLFSEIDFGVDNDPEALRIAAGYGVYQALIHTASGRIPLSSGAAESIVSNSVFEHVRDLEGVLDEIRRVLRPGGTLMATTPLSHFTRQIARYFGVRESGRLNQEYAHRHLYDEARWIALLEKHGFKVIEQRQYQPDYFTFWYRMFRLAGERGFGRMFPGIRGVIWIWWRKQFIAMVRNSINGTKVGGNLFFIARAL